MWCVTFTIPESVIGSNGYMSDDKLGDTFGDMSGGRFDGMFGQRAYKVNTIFGMFSGFKESTCLSRR